MPSHAVHIFFTEQGEELGLCLYEFGFTIFDRSILRLLLLKPFLTFSLSLQIHPRETIFPVYEVSDLCN